MPDMYLAAMQNAFQRHLDDDHSRQSMQDFITMCTRVAQMYHGFNASAAALLHVAKVLLAALHLLLLSVQACHASGHPAVVRGLNIHSRSTACALIAGSAPNVCAFAA